MADNLCSVRKKPTQVFLFFYFELEPRSKTSNKQLLREVSSYTACFAAELLV